MTCGEAGNEVMKRSGPEPPARDRQTDAATSLLRVRLSSPEHPISYWGVDGERYSSFYMHVHPENELSVVLSGSQVIHYADAIIQCSPGDVWFAAPGEIHGVTWRGELSGATLAFAPEFLGDAMLGDTHWFRVYTYPPAGRPRATQRRQRALLSELGWEIHRECTAKRTGWEEAVRVHVLEILLAVVRDWRPGTGAHSRPRIAEHATIRPALELVFAASRTHRRVGLKEAARACSMSRSLFCRVFREATGSPFGQFELRSRLSVAAYLLHTTRLSVAEIAARTGFSSTNHLDSRFSSEYGMTPTRSRLQAKRRAMVG